MATVQNMEKLTRLLRALESDSSLESAVAAERLNALILRTQQLIRQRSFLREERRRIRISAEKNESIQRNLETMRKPDWIGSRLDIVDHEGVLHIKEVRRVKINVGGLVFEISADVLGRDKTSLLATLDESSPNTSLVLPDDGIFYFDRDWWLFRYILRFMRDGMLPDDRTLLGQLYKEAGFWHLKELRRAIEEEKLHLREGEMKPLQGDAPLWWKVTPQWWAQSIRESRFFSSQIAAITAAQNMKPEISHALDSKSNAPNKEEDWWTGTTYKGKSFVI